MPKHLRLLMVEDSKEDVDLVLRTLFAGGYETVHKVVATLATMRAALKSQEWDVITSDHSMPEFSGSDALALARELRPDVPFIVVSGETGISPAVSLIREGAEDYVHKSELSRLVPVIERVLHEVDIQRKRKSAERALQVSESRYRRLFEAAQDGILILDAETGKIEDVNPYMLSLLGYSRDEYLGKTLWEIGAFKDIAASKSAFLELQANGYIRYENIPLHTSSGRDAEVELVSNVYLVDNKKVIQCNIRDITARRKAEAEVRKLNAELEQRVRERTTQVEALNKELETFNYSVSHDLRAPLRRISAFAAALDEDCSQQLDSQGKQLVQNIRASEKHLTGLIEALQKLASFSGGELRRGSTSLSAMALEIVSELQQTEPSRKVEFVIAPGITVAGDTILLRIVMENLLRNAWKFTSRCDSGRIEFGASPPNPLTSQSACCFIRDNGAGFEMKYASRLFGAFQRLHSEEDYPGTGIGLASVQRIIHRHGGRIWAEGKKDQGATFFFSLSGVDTI